MTICVDCAIKNLLADSVVSLVFIQGRHEDQVAGDFERISGINQLIVSKCISNNKNVGIDVIELLKEVTI